jgi:glycosyltransferase involved in cell wall biosynthesis
MTRVLMVSDVFFPRINGVSTSIDTFQQCLSAEGVEVTLVAPDYGNSTHHERLVRIPAKPVPNDPEDRFMRWGELHQTLNRLVPEHDVVHIQTPFLAHYAGLKAARAHGKPVVATYHTLFEEYLYHYVPWVPSAWMKGLARRFSRKQCNALNALIVPSTAMRQRLGDYGVNVPMQVIPTGIPLQRFHEASGLPFRQAHQIEADRPLSLFVGRVAHEKNIDFLIKAHQVALKQCPQALLLITGEGPALPDLHAMVAQLGLQDSVRFIGYLDRQHTLPQAYAAADVFVFASRTETQGLVLIEAMASATPVLALSIMGTQDIMRDAPGCITGVDDVQAFGQQMGQMLNDRAHCHDLGLAARETSLRWSDQALAARLANFYRQQL